MCITIGETELTNTILLAHSIEHEGEEINIVGYQNEAISDGPDAMLLPFPSRDPMSKENCIDLSDYPDLFKGYADLITPRSRGGWLSFKGPEAACASVEIFDSGSYTVLLATNAKYIPEALEKIPPHKRPPLNQKLFDFLERGYKTNGISWSIGLCCWDGRIKPEPLLWWYNPLPSYQGKHFLPGLDAHNGDIPQFTKPVNVDTKIVIGVKEKGIPSEHLLHGIPSTISYFLPSQILGGVLPSKMNNGDWVLPKTGWDDRNVYERLTTKRSMPPLYKYRGEFI